ncbi:G-type lectin S-receptor-like serine/threonine-protein kinase At4g27290 [Andrographis paniculata]|uniref:G-type lectin S-receptor-like serine/threonine-protein kinase At4g27290 n=1 Tax=Andrographis paniculata TaxID=175694 RepID=UPI0021E71E8C|nr:G-type lectin S-receptor-like serine/threonine-protein kinase At4g27290 [Andrographis paniculata]
MLVGKYCRQHARFSPTQSGRLIDDSTKTTRFLPDDDRTNSKHDRTLHLTNLLQDQVIMTRRTTSTGHAAAVLLIFFFFLSEADPDAIDTTQSITHNNTLISSKGKFELGFFTPGSSNKWFLGIWYKNITVKTVVWVANRESPLPNTAASPAVLKVIPPGFLVLLSATNTTVWSSSNKSTRIAKNPVAQLLDSGNLILRDADDRRPENYLWQSFDHPTDTLLPEMQLGANSVPGGDNYLSCWKNSDDPGNGDYTIRLDPAGYPQLITKRNGTEVYRLGPWLGTVYSGTPQIKKDMSYKFGIYRNKDGFFYYREDAIVPSAVLTRYTLSPNGVGQRWHWVDPTQRWVLYMSNPIDDCDAYGACGAHGSCTVGDYPVCSCLDRFRPRDPKVWSESAWSTSGCVRQTPLDCAKGDGFLRYLDIKFPDARNSTYNETMSLEECRTACLNNCSCMAYSRLNISTGGHGCLMWFGDLIDIRTLPAPGQFLYVRMASSELDSNRKMKLAVSLVTVGTFLVGICVVLYVWRTKKNSDKGEKSGMSVAGVSEDKDLELPMFGLSTISKATDNFASQNKLGEGGYGPVYKGVLEDGQNIAVKRLSETSRQGLDEFKNEVICIANLQHRNLVKLLGCCIQGDEKMLIYEFLENRSLDLALFDKTSRAPLDWPQRIHILNGIARGLMYLHQDSSLRIIHRDLKASNILLDGEMNAKISDFGIAKSYGGNETEGLTSRVVGTYGYMSPEYAVSGRFSVKSDVFSFGVILLEIASGKRNSSYSHGDRSLNLLGHAWMLYREGRSIEVVDSHLQELDDLEKAARLVHIGLLCVQQHPDDRPSMSSVVAMLSNDNELPAAKQPGFFAGTDVPRSSGSATSSTNDVTITTLGGR